MPGLPHLQAHGFNHLKTRLWRPGEAHNHSGGTYKHPVRSFIILEGLDLRTNPFKGGGDGAILDGPDLSNSPSSEEGHQHGLLSLEEEALDVCCGPLELVQKRETTWAQEEDVTKAHMFKTTQVKEASGLWPSPVKRPPEFKSIKRPFHVWCWTCTRKKRRSPMRSPINQLVGLITLKAL